jgi:hypothetical protein
MLEMAHLVVVFDPDYMPRRASSATWPTTEQNNAAHHQSQRELVREITVHDSEKAVDVTFPCAIQLRRDYVQPGMTLGLFWEWD